MQSRIHDHWKSNPQEAALTIGLCSSLSLTLHQISAEPLFLPRTCNSALEQAEEMLNEEEEILSSNCAILFKWCHLVPWLFSANLWSRSNLNRQQTMNVVGGLPKQVICDYSPPSKVFHWLLYASKEERLAHFFVFPTLDAFPEIALAYLSVSIQSYYLSEFIVFG